MSAIPTPAGENAKSERTEGLMGRPEGPKESLDSRLAKYDELVALVRDDLDTGSEFTESLWLAAELLSPARAERDRYREALTAAETALVKLGTHPEGTCMTNACLACRYVLPARAALKELRAALGEAH